MNRARATGQVISLDYSSLSVCFGYLAGALGISFIPIKSLIATEVLDRLEAGPAAEELRRMKCPFTGEDYLLLKAGLQEQVVFSRKGALHASQFFSGRGMLTKFESSTRKGPHARAC